MIGVSKPVITHQGINTSATSIHDPRSHSPKALCWIRLPEFDTKSVDAKFWEVHYFMSTYKLWSFCLLFACAKIIPQYGSCFFHTLQLMCYIIEVYRYTVGKITPVPMREVRSSDFGERARIRMYFPRKGSQFTPPHHSVDFYWKDYCPMVFRYLSSCCLHSYFWLVTTLIFRLKNICVGTFDFMCNSGRFDLFFSGIWGSFLS